MQHQGPILFHVLPILSLAAGKEKGTDMLMCRCLLLWLRGYTYYFIGFDISDPNTAE